MKAANTNLTAPFGPSSNLTLFGSHAGIVAVFKKACLLAFSIGLSLVLGEGVIRLFFAEPINPRYVHDSGFGIRDNQSHVRAHHSSPGEYEVDISTNSDGLRGGKDYDLTTPSGTRRIAILGDSFAFGYGCNDSQVVSAILERDLNDKLVGGSKWEVLNFGVSGYGQAEELILYRNKTRRYRPDIVILFYFDNDIGDNVVADIFALGPDSRAQATGKSFLPGTALQQRMYDTPLLRWFLLHSQALSLVRNRLSSMAQNHLLHKVGLRDYNEGSAYGIALTRALLLELRQEVESDGSYFIVVIIPNNDNPATTNFPLSREEWQPLKLSVVDGRDFVDRSDYYVRDGHWKPSGHRKAAKILTAMLLKEVPQLLNSHARQVAPGLQEPIQQAKK